MNKQKKDSKSEKNAQEPEKEIERKEENAETADAQTETTDAQTETAEDTGNADPEELLRQQLGEEKDKFLRLAAEYDNYRKRSQKEREALYSDIKSDTIAQMLPVYDNLERALAHETCDEAFYKGVEMTMTGLKVIMEKMGVKEVPALGKTFDPQIHNAVVHVEDESRGVGEIVEELQKGFTLGDKVIRFSLVKVAN